MTNPATKQIDPVSETNRQNNLSLKERLALINLIDEGMRGGSSNTPIITDLFNNLWELVSTTVSGSKIDRFKPKETHDEFDLFEINSESGENLGRLNMLYLKKPLPCYYLVYVEVAPPFRRKGLGNRILEHFSDFLREKSAIGILDNIIPEDDVTYDIYLKHSWEPIENFIENGTDSYENYMVWVPPRLYGKDLREQIIKLLYHLRRKRESIDMRENEIMVRRTLSEFRELYSALLTYFEEEISQDTSIPLMRFMFTRFTTKFISFRRRIGELIGYTGGESTEQIAFTPEIASMPVQSYAPYDPAEGTYIMKGDKGLQKHVSEIMKNHPSRVIEALPEYGRPSYLSWLREKGFDKEHKLTIGDLMDLGFDPTRLKEISIDGVDYIFERMQARQLKELEKKTSLLLSIEKKTAGLVARKARLMVNPPLLTIRDRGNAYVLRRKVGGIHLEEALEQIQISPALKGLNESLGLNRLLIDTVGTAIDLISEKEDMHRDIIHETITFFVSWDLKKNSPELLIDLFDTSLKTVWAA